MSFDLRHVESSPPIGKVLELGGITKLFVYYACLTATSIASSSLVKSLSLVQFPWNCTAATLGRFSRLRFTHHTVAKAIPTAIAMPIPIVMPSPRLMHFWLAFLVGPITESYNISWIENSMPLNLNSLFKYCWVRTQTEDTLILFKKKKKKKTPLTWGDNPFTETLIILDITKNRI